MAYLTIGVIRRIVVFYVIPKVMQPDIFIPERQVNELRDPTVCAMIEDCAVFWEAALASGDTQDLLTQVMLRYYTIRPPLWDDDIEFVQIRMLNTAKAIKSRLESISHATRGLVEVDCHWSQIFWLGDRGWYGLHTTFRRKRLQNTFKVLGIAQVACFQSPSVTMPE
ncbi:hypothetical protein CC1G_03485 [Coprinopsis cinerea okayama7|uniref:Uncharacterized protein n=1 Tax=Coprinopsis cinerea (strain Okayama-7 / 130 / ATCC MYA-4618 / FGSC 9003) TaxID=240176 RepID=A8NCC7_COPC7|nr:hypothetical protein CC1G_03485 [Coprinopsis cinerea okayama7\|eukprot:XP_001832471.2 hypothetical protein CC1G_03485 [Coprinopsis cinerea okayama7\